MAIREAKGSEILILEELAQRCFDKFSFKEKGVSYCKSSFILRLKEFINSSLFQCLVYEEDNNVIGFSIVSLIPGFYDLSVPQVNEIGMQADPSLPKVKQGKIIISFIRHIENVGKKLGAKIVGFSISPDFDISNYLMRNGYFLTDKVYMKGVV